MDRCFRAAAARAWVDRRPQYRNRVSVGGGALRPLVRARRRAHSAQGRCHRHAFTFSYCRGKTGDLGHPHRLCSGSGPGEYRRRRQSGAAGGNVTGLSNQFPEAAGKRVELVREVVPSLHQLAILASVGSATAPLEVREVEAAARKLGLQAATSGIRRAEDIEPAITALVGRAEALYVFGEPLTTT